LRYSHVNKDIRSLILNAHGVSWSTDFVAATCPHNAVRHGEFLGAPTRLVINVWILDNHWTSTPQIKRPEHSTIGCAVSVPIALAEMRVFGVKWRSITFGCSYLRVAGLI
jgi:hypothetical protein